MSVIHVNLFFACPMLMFHELFPTGEALIAFKKAITNSDGVFLNWREQDADPCNWKGVRCNNHSKRVIYL